MCRRRDSLDERIRLMDDVNDEKLLSMSTERLSNFNPADKISNADVNKELGIADADLEGFIEVEFE